MYLGLDMGGTHTDAVILDKQSIVAKAKVVTNHECLESSIKQALTHLLYTSNISPSCITRATFGSTLAINSIIQKKQKAVGLILGAGPGINPTWSAVGDSTFLTSSQLDHRGTELTCLEESPLLNCLKKWQDKGIHTFACVSKFSVRNPKHENEMEQLIQKTYAHYIQQPFISKGHTLSDSLNFPRRIATTYWNAAVWELHSQFIDAIKTTLKELQITAPTFLLKADGGSIPLDLSRMTPIEAIHSGPAASIMGILALCPITTDCILLDMGGTTTDIALLTKGQPILSPYGLIIQNRPTLVRALLSHSIALGGDSLITITEPNGKLNIHVGPLREGPAMAFGGILPTFLDCLNVAGYASEGDTKNSYIGIQTLADNYTLSVAELTSTIITSAQQQLYNGIQHVLHEANNNPIHTLEALLEQHTIYPKQCILTGGPSKCVVPLLQNILDIPVTTPHNYTSMTNAIGAALTTPTASLELFADTEKQYCNIPSLGLQYTIPKNYSLEQACNDASKFLSMHLKKCIKNASTISIDIIEAKEFSIIDPFGHKGKDIRVRCQVRPALAYPLY